MTDVNKLILEKLKLCPTEVAKLSEAILKVANNLTDQALCEKIQTLIRATVRGRGEK